MQLNSIARQIIRFALSLLLWSMAVLGVVVGLCWIGASVGVVAFPSVQTGSMEPEIREGDLLIDVGVDTGTLSVGDIVTVPNDITGNLVTHRIVELTPRADGNHLAILKGDNNRNVDGNTYVLGDQVLQPIAVVPRAGYYLDALSRHQLPLTVGYLALIVAIPILLSWLDRPRQQHRDDTSDDGFLDGASHAAENAGWLVTDARRGDLAGITDSGKGDSTSPGSSPSGQRHLPIP